jgi:hypothetical protein
LLLLLILYEQSDLLSLLDSTGRGVETVVRRSWDTTGQCTTVTSHLIPSDSDVLWCWTVISVLHRDSLGTLANDSTS